MTDNWPARPIVPAVPPCVRQADTMATIEDLGDETYCYLTTTGRVTGRGHTIEIWYALLGVTVYLLSGEGDRSDWVRNVTKNPSVGLRIGAEEFAGHARVVTSPAEERLARGLLHAKYQPSYPGDLSEWRDTALPVAIDLPQMRL